MMLIMLRLGGRRNQQDTERGENAPSGNTRGHCRPPYFTSVLRGYLPSVQRLLLVGLSPDNPLGELALFLVTLALSQTFSRVTDALRRMVAYA